MGSDLDNNLNDELKALIINVPLSVSPNTRIKDVKRFIISFEAIKHAKIMTSNFTNRAFDHFFTSNSFTAFDDSTADMYLFTYITTKWYISDKFYGIMIDTGASKYSTADYR